MADREQNPTGKWLQFLLGGWIVAAQIYYFYLFSPTFGPLLRALSHKVWH